MATKAPTAASSRTKNTKNTRASSDAGGAHRSSGGAPEFTLSAEREAELLREAESLGDNASLFPGKLARRVIWASRIQLAAERDAADLVLTPFAEGEPPLTGEEISGLREKIELLRVVQSRWQAAQQRQERASAAFQKPAAEAVQIKQSLLRFFDLRFKKSPEGQKRLMAIRAGSGDPDLVQDTSDLLLLCSEHAEAVQKAPRGEAAAADRLRELSPLLARMLADKTLSLEAVRSRKLRDAVYTLVVNAERRLRAAAEYWYAGTDKMKDYAPFPASRGAYGGGGAEGEDGGESEEAEPEDGESEEGESGDDEAGDDGESP
ncbi:ATPase [Sorangium atrum]|uniref:ATPase n=1 Tax=Sorangium atrum TaxID=2995308 RepID=A0ABT5CFI8_9BACT|nr:ATPase [Sorangium aterium]MDC0683856.1 ATPase [Sorangium aterium]